MAAEASASQMASQPSDGRDLALAVPDAAALQREADAMSVKDLSGLQKKWSSFKSYTNKKASPEAQEAKESLLEAGCGHLYFRGAQDESKLVPI